MKWERISCTPEQEVYKLYKGETRILTLTLHPFSHSARVETGNEKRVFQIRKEGFLRNKTVLRTEYGIKLGELGHENGRSFINIENERYFYSIINNPLAELQIFKEQAVQPMITCGLKTEEGNPEVRFKKDKNQADDSYSSLLMALCWYMFLPVAKENTPEMAM
jgi:hypothetical protein